MKLLKAQGVVHKSRPRLRGGGGVKSDKGKRWWRGICLESGLFASKVFRKESATVVFYNNYKGLSRRSYSRAWSDQHEVVIGGSNISNSTDVLYGRLAGRKS